MAYVDIYLAPVPRKNRGAYQELASISAGVLRECGALRVVECWAGESGPDAASYHATEARQEPGRGHAETDGGSARAVSGSPARV